MNNSMVPQQIRNLDIAIIGMNCRVPGARDVEQFWANLVAGKESIARLSDDELRAAGVEEELLRNPSYIKVAAKVEQIEEFDAAFFGFNPREAQMMDPQQRLFVEAAWQTLESAGYAQRTSDHLVGVYAGTSASGYLSNLVSHNLLADPTDRFFIELANEKDSLATVTSNRLDLRGPSLTIQTACSTSLVAVHVACQALLGGECDMALAGGVSIAVPAGQGYLYQEGGIQSPDGHCRAFDVRGQGTVAGSGLGMVLLKRLGEALGDGDHIYAVIKGSAINNDGGQKVGYTAPSVEGQARVIRAAQAVAEVEAESISYVEAHGTGTMLGDPIEVAALTEAFGRGEGRGKGKEEGAEGREGEGGREGAGAGERGKKKKRQWCGLGSVKTNVGHLDAAAGVVGLIKTALALERGQLPASLHYEVGNRKIDFEGSPFYVNGELREWKGERPLRAGVSSFGIGGTNAHVVVEEGPREEREREGREEEQLLVISGRSGGVVERGSAELAEYLKGKEGMEIGDVAYTLQVGRKGFERRRVVVCGSVEEGVAGLEGRGGVWRKDGGGGGRGGGRGKVVFVFSGQGAQRVGMGRELYERGGVYREVVDRCSEELKKWMGMDVREVLYPGEGKEGSGEERLGETWVTQAAMFVVEYGMARQWMEWGVKPEGMIGHSIGEYVAACVGGVMREEDALRLVAMRGRLMQEMEGGGMVAVWKGEEEVRRYMRECGGGGEGGEEREEGRGKEGGKRKEGGEGLSVAAVNSRGQCVVAGKREEIEKLEERLKGEGVEYERLRTSHGFHSWMMEPMLERYGEEVKKVRLGRPEIRFVSNVTGDWIEEAEARDWRYWVKQVREPVRFGAGVERIGREGGERVWLEVGPGRTLGGLVEESLEAVKGEGERESRGAEVLSTLGSGRGRGEKAGGRGERGGGEWKEMLKALGGLWVRGVEIEWAKVHAGRRRHRVPLPTYPFERQRYWIDAAEVERKDGTETGRNRSHGVLRKRTEIKDWFYVPTWKQSVGPFLVASRNQERREWLLFADDSGLGDDLAQQLRSNGQNVVVVREGEKFEQQEEEVYRIAAQCKENYEQLLKELRERQRMPERIIHTWALDSGKQHQGQDKAEIREQMGFYSLLFLAQALGREKERKPLEMMVVTEKSQLVNGEEWLPPEQATLLGLCIVISQEHPNLQCRAIDVLRLEGGRRERNRLVQQLLTELQIKRGEKITAYRGPQRWVRGFEQLQMERNGEAPKRLRKSGVYLITGGLGQIGLEIARYLATKITAKIVLIGRSWFPAETEWTQWLAEYDPQNGISRTIGKLEELRMLGAEVLVMHGDVAEKDQMRAVVEDVHKRWGAVHGVFHAAGLTDSEWMKSIEDTTERECEAHFGSKLRGARVLAEVLAEEKELDFCMLFSSLSSLLGGLGYGAYAAGNCSMDAYALSRIQAREREEVQRHTWWTSVNWEGWAFEGKEADGRKKARTNGNDDGRRSTVPELSLSPEEGIAALDWILGLEGEIGEIIVSTGDLEARWRRSVSGEVGEGKEEGNHKIGWQDEAGALPLKQQGKRARGKKQGRNEAEERIITIWQRLLGLEEIGREENFFEIGGNSLLAIKLLSELRNEFAPELRLEDVFNHATVAALTVVVAGTQEGEQGTAEEERIRAIWRKLLGREEIGQEENFFEIGGNSLLAIKLLSDLRKEFARQVKLEDVFNHATLAELAQLVTAGDEPASTSESQQERQRTTEASRKFKPELVEGVRGADRAEDKSRLKAWPRPEQLPLSYAQQRLWFLDRVQGGSTEYNLPEAMRLRGELDMEVLRRVLNTIVERHEVLRTHFGEVEGQPVQIVEAERRVDVKVEDLSGMKAWEQEQRITHGLEREWEQGFDLSRGPLLRMRLLKLGEREHVLLRTFHHVVHDLWSVDVWNREFKRLYEAFSEGKQNPLPSLAVQYADFALWQREMLSEEVLRGHLQYWREQLEGAPEELELGKDHDRGRQQKMNAASCPAIVGIEVLTGLKRLAKEEQVTSYMLLLSAFTALLYRYGGGQDIVVGMPIANRQDEQLEKMLGFFVNTLALRVQVNPTGSFRALMAGVRRVAIGAYEHQDLPFERLVQELAPARALNRNPIFQVTFNYQGVSGREQWNGKLGVEMLSVEQQRVRNDLELYAWESPNGIAFSFVYNRELFDHWRIERMATHYARLLGSIAVNPDVYIGDLELLSPEEQQTITEIGNRTACNYPGNSFVHELFANQAGQNSEALALIDQENYLTYAELNRRANQLAHYLQKRGVGPEVLVGICLERSINMVVALLAVLKSGGCYVPLDPEYPENRLKYLWEVSEISFVITSDVLARRLSLSDESLITFDKAGSSWQTESTSNSVSSVLPENLAYVIYTSGSTGRPKGVCITHEALLNHMCWMQEKFPVGREDRMLQKTPFGFDAAVLEFFAPLLNGATLVLAQSGGHRRADYLIQALRENKITLLQCVPSQFEMLLEAEGLELCRNLRRVFCGGESLKRRTVTALKQRMSEELEIINFYGPTEATIDATFWTSKPGSFSAEIPIGVPIANTQIYILDENLNVLPKGTRGELYIAGMGLARGYLKKPDLTAERFLPNPFGEHGGDRLYRTGDLGRHRADGNIEFHGRADQQLKIRGVRIEPGEIESALCEHSAVKEAVILAQNDSSGQKRLVGYVVLQDGITVTSDFLREHLARNLPLQMVPSVIRILDSFPRLPNGKLDHHAFAAPEWQSSHGYHSPRSPQEEILCWLFAQVLDLKCVGIDDNFFELGGHSLTATRLVSQIRAILGVDLPLRLVFEAPTVALLSPHLHKSHASRPVLSPRKRLDRIPLSYAQQRLWFLDQLGGSSIEYNMPQAMRLRGRLDLQALEKAINRIVERHEVLRTRFTEAHGEPEQIIEPSLRITIPIEDLSRLDAVAREESMASALEQECNWPFDLSRAPLLRLKILKLGEEEHILLCTFHHIVSDGWSSAVFNRDLMLFYEAFLEGRNPILDPLPIQYADFALWQRDWLTEDMLREGLDYWKRQLAGIPERLELATDYPRPSVQTFLADYCAVVLSREMLAGLNGLAYKGQATLFMTLLTALGVLLERYTGQDDIVLGTSIANRQEAQLEKLIGFFVNRLVMRVRLGSNQAFKVLLSAVRSMTLKAYEHQDVPFERLVEELSPERRLDRTPLFQVGFTLQNTPVVPHSLKGVILEPVGTHVLQVRCDLELHAVEQESGLGLYWLYNRDLFDRSRMEKMAHHYSHLLQAMAAAGLDRRICEIDLLGAAERRQVLEEWNSTAASFRNECIHRFFEEQVKQTPEAPAAIHLDRQLTFAELNGRANQLGRYLRELGVGPEVSVGIFLPRGLDMVTAILAVLKAGGAYIPLDTRLPQQRLAMILKDAQPKVVLTMDGLARHLPENASRLLCLDVELEIAALSESNLADVTVRPEMAAYLLYTSGSTGTPKGVVIEHQQVANYLYGVNEIGELPACKTFIMLQPLSVDSSVTVLFSSLCRGGCLYLIPEDMATDSAELAGYLREHPGDCLKIAPSHLAALQSGAEPGLFVPRKRLIVGGEASDRSWLMTVQRMAPDCAIFNHYGPTETTVGVLMHRLCDKDDQEGFLTAPVGRPMPNVQVYILDKHLQLVPAGIPGELYIAGAALGRGYLNRSGLTAERFVANPFGPPGTRMYHTGDLARWLRNGNIEFLGRSDRQIKIRGFRIELGEIEAALRNHSAIQDAVATMQLQGEEKRLVAYVVQRQSASSNEEAQLSYIREWQRVYEAKTDFNVGGWNSSYTGQPIPAAEMKIWLDEIVGRIVRFRPARVLDIGCGAGTLLARIAGGCDSYIGLDFSGQALAELGQHLEKIGPWPHVQLRLGLAHELSFVPDQSMDLVILNSVVQYFPDMDYLQKVLSEALRVTRDGGHIVIGDVRSFPLLEAYHTSVQLHKAAGDLPLAELRQRIRQSCRNEEELVIDAAFFEELARRWERPGKVEICLKAGDYDNELSRFRYNVVIEVGRKETIADPEQWVAWDQSGHWRDAITQIFLHNSAVSVGLRGIRDRRVAPAITAAQLLQSEGECVHNVEQLRSSCRETGAADLNEILNLAAELKVEIQWRQFNADGMHEAIFNTRWQPQKKAREMPSSYYARYANAPAQRSGTIQFVHDLQAHLRTNLPEYMVPSTIIVLSAWPLTQHGKLDRKALPTPDSISAATWKPPQTSQEQALCGIFAEALGLQRVSVDDNFFAMGGHSLMATRVIGRIRTSLGINLPVRKLFEHPTVRDLAQHLETDLSFKNLTDSFVVWHPHGDLDPLFCLPAVTGLGWSYAGLMQELDGRRPIYALQASGLASESPLAAGLQEAAAEYISVIRRIQPKGPYHLLGWSFGGVVAHEVACRLQGQSEQINMLALLDAYPSPRIDPAAGKGESFDPQAPEMIEAFAVLLGLDTRNLAGKSLKMNSLLELAKHSGHIVGLFDPQQIRRMLRIAAHNSSLLLSSTPGRFQGDLLLFQATEDQPAFRSPNRWAPHITGEIKVHQIRCRHADMTQARPISKIAKLIEHELRLKSGTVVPMPQTLTTHALQETL